MYSIHYGVREMKRLLGIAAGLVLLANSAGAAIIVSLDSVTPDASGLFRWTYRAMLQPDQAMLEGDFFTIYDVPSFVSGASTFGTSLSPALDGRSFAVNDAVGHLLGDNAPGTTLGDIGTGPQQDDPDLRNITVSLTSGGTIDPADDAPGPVTLGNLFVLSTSDRDLRVLTDYGAQNHLGPLGPIASNVGEVLVPAVIPEPGSVTLMMVGLIAVGALAFRRRQTD
jgi:PEP-CTERM motif